MKTKLPSFNRPRVLVVEDNPLVRQVSTGLLQMLNCETIEAGDGFAALGLLQSGRPVDLLFTDIILPGHINGFRLAELGRRQYPRLKVLFTSGYTCESLPIPGGQAVEYPMLRKPFGLAELSEALVRLLPDAVIRSGVPMAASA
jgi:CheY-like chemotaxis protein